MEIKDKAIEAVRKAGLIEPRKPEVEIEFPDDLTALSSQELGQLMTRYTAFVVYSEYLVAMSDIDYSSSTNALEFVRGRELLKERVQEYRNVSERNAMVDQNKDVIGLKQILEGHKSKRYLAKALYSGYQQMVGAVSREISRRGMEVEMSKRGI